MRKNKKQEDERQMKLNFRVITPQSIKPVETKRLKIGLPNKISSSKLQRSACDQKKPQALFFDNRIHKFLSTREASGLLGVSENALRILVCRKRVKAYKLGRRLKFKAGDLMDCLQQKEV